jgi:hypothetical protein
MRKYIAEWARLRCRVGWWGACGWGSGMPAPSGQILTLGVVGKPGSHHEGRVQPVPGLSRLSITPAG